MRKVLRVVVPVCAAIFVANLVIVNTVYRNEEISDDLWPFVVGLGLFVCGFIAIVGGSVLVATRLRRDG
jgi:hypothetical protein